MAITRSVPLTFKPRGLSDAIDGSNVGDPPHGNMASLANLIPDPNQPNSWVCRPAATIKTFFPGFLGAGIPSTRLIVGDLEYGMLPTDRFPGLDEPYVYDLANNTFLTLSGVTAAQLPATQPATGDWTPATMAQIGSRILVTHPGFSGNNKFGWFDVSGFSLTTTGNLATSYTVIGDTDLTNPGSVWGYPVDAFANFIEPGAGITGTGIPAATTVTVVEANTQNTTGDIHSNTVIDNILSMSGIYVGMTVTANGVPFGTTVATVGPGNQLSLSQNATATVGGVALRIYGSRIGLSQNVTATNNGVSFTVTPAAGQSVITGNPSVVGVQPRYAISGSAIPAGTTVLATREIVVQKSGMTTAGFPYITIQGDTGGLSVGMLAEGLGLPLDTTISALTSTSVQLSANVLNGNSFPVTFTFTGATITISAPPTASGNGVTLTITGGTRTSPQWGAGDTDRTPLPAQPVGVAQMNGRAWFACGADGIPYSDAGFPGRISNSLAVQALTTNDGLAVTAIAPLMLSALNPGGIVQSLIAFQGVAGMQQISGDQTTSDLAMNRMPVATGTAAPNAIFTCELGTGFLSPEGLRFITFDGKITPPVGDAGLGVTVPFINTAHPSRMCAAANSHFIRITTQNAAAEGSPFEEYWYDIGRQAWCGPHTSAAASIQAWRDSFILAPQGIAGVLWNSTVVPSAGSSYNENGRDLQWKYMPCLLPDNQSMAMNKMVQTLIALSGPMTGVVQCEVPNTDSVQIVFSAGSVWGSAIWNQAPWSGGGTYRQYTVPWSRPLTFKQLLINFRGFSAPEIRIGNLYMRYEILRYTNPPVAVDAAA